MFTPSLHGEHQNRNIDLSHVLLTQVTFFLVILIINVCLNDGDLLKTLFSGMPLFSEEIVEHDESCLSADSLRNQDTLILTSN